MLKVAAYSKIAVEAGIIPADQMRRVFSQYQASGGGEPFETWAVSAGVLTETAIDRLRVAYGQAVFRCVGCQAKIKGDELVGEAHVACPKCGHDTFRRVRGSEQQPPPAPASEPAELDRTVESSRSGDSQHKAPSTSETAFEINASGSPSDSAGSALPPPPPPPQTQAGSAATLQATGAEPAPHDFERGLQPGQRIGNWEIIRMAGKGGMGAVYQARNPDLDQYAAIKVLNANYLESSQQVTRFREEARACAKLEHPNIIQVKDFGTIHGRAYLILQWVEGGSLGDRLKQFGPIAVPDFLDIAIQTCRGLGEAHRYGIIHRDIKPDNIMISAKDGRVKVADFGLAKSLEAKEGLTATGAFLGTPAYMAPEQINNENIHATTDIYALGGTFYTMLTAKVPFKAPSVATVLHMHIAQAFPDVREVAEHVPEDVAELLKRMCAKKQEDRIQTLDEVAGVLEGVWANLTDGGEQLAEFQRRAGGSSSAGGSLVSSREGGLVGDTLDSQERVGQDRKEQPSKKPQAGKRAPQQQQQDKRPEQPERRTGQLLPVFLALGVFVALIAVAVAYLLISDDDEPLAENGNDNQTENGSNDGDQPGERNGGGGGDENGGDNGTNGNDTEPNGELTLEESAERVASTGTLAAAEEMIAEIEALLAGDEISAARRTRLEGTLETLQQILPVLERGDELDAAALSATNEVDARQAAEQISAFLDEHPAVRPRFEESLIHLEEILGEPAVPARFETVAEWRHELLSASRQLESALEGDSFARAEFLSRRAGWILNEVDEWLASEARRDQRRRLQPPRGRLEETLQTSHEHIRLYHRFEAVVEEANSRLEAVEQAMVATEPDLELIANAKQVAPERIEQLRQARDAEIVNYREVRDAFDDVLRRLQRIERFDIADALPPSARLWIERAGALDHPVCATRYVHELNRLLDARPAWQPFLEGSRNVAQQVADLEVKEVDEASAEPDLPLETLRFQNVHPLILRRVVSADTWGGSGEVRELSFFGSSARLVATRGTDILNVYNLGSGDVERTLSNGDARVNALARSHRASQDFLVAGAADGVARVHPARGTVRQTLERFQGEAEVTVVAHTGSGQDARVVVGTSHGQAIVANQFTREADFTLTEASDALRAAAVTHNGNTLLLAGDDGVVRLYAMSGLREGRLVATLEGHHAPVLDLAVSTDDRYAVSASADGSLIVWDLQRERMLTRLLGHGGAVTGCVFNGDSRYLISGSADGTIRVWDTHDEWRVALTADLYTDAEYEVTSLAISPDGQRLAAGTDRGDALVFDLTR